MQASIQKVLGFGLDSRALAVQGGRLTPRDSSSSERVLAGGVSVEDVLQDAFVSLLKHDPSTVRSWKGLAQRIAHARAVDAVRNATKGRRDASSTLADAEYDAIGVSSVENLDLETTFGGSTEETEDEYLRIEQQLVLRNVARELLPPRDLKIFLEIHFRGTPRAALGEEFGITSARVTQIYRTAIRRVREASRDDPAFSVPDPREEDE